MMKIAGPRRLTESAYVEEAEAVSEQPKIETAHWQDKSHWPNHIAKSH